MSDTGVSVTAAPTSEPGDAGRGRLRGNPMLTLLSVALGVMMVALDGTIVAVANPSIQAHLHASLAGIQWVTNGYLLSLAVTPITIGIIALVVGSLVLKETPPSAARSFEVPGIALLSVTLFLLVFDLIKASAWGWGSGRTIGFFAGAAVGLALFILRERRAAQPLLPLRLFRSVPLSAGVVLVVLLMFACSGPCSS